MNEDQMYDAAEREMDLYRAEVTRMRAAHEAEIASLTEQRNRVSDTADQLRKDLAAACEGITAYTEALAAGKAELDAARGRLELTENERNSLADELRKVKHLLDDFTHAVIDTACGKRMITVDRVVPAARAIRKKAGLPVVGQFGKIAGPPS